MPAGTPREQGVPGRRGDAGSPSDPPTFIHARPGSRAPSDPSAWCRSLCMPENASRPRVRLAVVLAFLASVAFALWIGLRIGGTLTTEYVDDVATVLAALAATSLCFRAASRNEGRLRLFWLLLALACGAWTLAETIWAGYDLVLHQAVPVPSWADIGYLSAIPLVVAALVVHPAMSDSAARRARATLDGLVLATAVAFLGWSVVLGPLWHRADMTTLGGVVAVAYPFGDIVTLVLVVLIVRALQPGGRTALWFVLGGIVAMALSDSAYAYLTVVRGYVTGDLADVGWIVAYLCIAVGAYSGAAADSSAIRPAHAETPTTVSLVAPYAVVLVALAVTAVEIQLGRHLGRVAWFMAMGLVGLVLVRQGLLFVDSVRLEMSHRDAEKPISRHAAMAGAAADDSVRAPP